MALKDRPVPSLQPDPERAADRVRRHIGQVVGQAQAAMVVMRRANRSHGQALIDALGTDAEEMVPTYKALKDMLAVLDPGTPIPDIDEEIPGDVVPAGMEGRRLGRVRNPK